ncbi:hypothetical protein VTP01DRAFT_978, partial [Rhizomucor pusillus]|uniref:uncharacterized protein n=1 Tax=Rhizomucor pusillus TaxID=4840 RepID=UPI0037432B34
MDVPEIFANKIYGERCGRIAPEGPSLGANEPTPGTKDPSSGGTVGRTRPCAGNTDDARLLESLLNNPDTCWAVNEAIDSSHNQVIMEALQEYIKNLPEREKNPAWTRSIVLDKLKNQLTTQHSALQEMPAKKKAYEENQHFYQGVQGVEDLLRSQYMSDEEEIVVENRRLAGKVLRPTWRSERANDLLHQLCELAKQRNARLSKRACPDRPRMVIEETEITMNAEDLPRASATVRALSPSLRATLSIDYN